MTFTLHYEDNKYRKASESTQLLEDLRLGFAGADMVSLLEFQENSGFGKDKSYRIMKDGIEGGAICKKRFVIKRGAATMYCRGRDKSEKGVRKRPEKFEKSVHKSPADVHKSPEDVHNSDQKTQTFSRQGEEVESGFPREKFFKNRLDILPCCPEFLLYIKETDLTSSLRAHEAQKIDEKKEVGEKNSVEENSVEEKKEVGALLDFAPLLEHFHGPKAEFIKNAQKHPYFRRSLFYGALIFLDTQKTTKDALNVVFKVLQNPDADLLDRIPENCTYETAVLLHERFLSLYVSPRNKIELASEHEEAKLNLNITRTFDEKHSRTASNPIRNDLGLLKHFIANEDTYRKPRRLTTQENKVYLEIVEPQTTKFGVHVCSAGVTTGETFIAMHDPFLIQKVDKYIAISEENHRQEQNRREQYHRKEADRQNPMINPAVMRDNEDLIGRLSTYDGSYIQNDVIMKVAEEDVNFVGLGERGVTKPCFDPRLRRFYTNAPNFVGGVTVHVEKYDKIGVVKTPLVYNGSRSTGGTVTVQPAQGGGGG